MEYEDKVRKCKYCEYSDTRDDGGGEEELFCEKVQRIFSIESKPCRFFSYSEEIIEFLKIKMQIEEMAPAFFYLFKGALRRFEPDFWKLSEGYALQCALEELESDFDVEDESLKK